MNPSQPQQPGLTPPGQEIKPRNIPPGPLPQPLQPSAQPTRRFGNELPSRPAVTPPSTAPQQSVMPAPNSAGQPAGPGTSTPPADVMQKAAANDRRRTLKTTVRSFLSFVTFVVTVVVAAWLINHFVFQSYYVDGDSMTPTLHNDDRLIIDKIGRSFAGFQNKPYIPSRGEIVILDSTLLDRYGRDEQLIKRVIGLPGDTVAIKDGTVTIKNTDNPRGFNVDEELGLQVPPTYTESPIEVTVPEGSVYVLGDNRGQNGSFDSRMFGVVKSEKIQGRLIVRIFPFDRVQLY